MSTTPSRESEASPQLGVPTGHGQRLAYLLAVVAANQARHRDARLTTAVSAAEAAGPEAVEELLRRTEQVQAAAETRMQTIPWHNPPAQAAVLADALLWHPTSTLAATCLGELTRSYAQDWGVLIDAENLRVSIDEQFDAVTAQDHTHARQLFARESAVTDFVSAMPAAARTGISQAISRWHGQIDPAEPRRHLDSEAERREQLHADLAAAGLPESERARIEFATDYLRADTSGVDLLTSPVLVDPGEETRSRVPRLLELFAHNPKSGREVATEIAVMSAADQERVRQAGREIARSADVEFNVWGYLDRYELGEALLSYADDMAELRADADYLTDPTTTDEDRDRLGAVLGSGDGLQVTDEVNLRLPRMAAQREALRTQILDGKGLHPIERAHLHHVLADIDTGRIHGHQELPELLFVDERSKADLDTLRIGKPAAQLAAATREAITTRIAATEVLDPRGRDSDRLKFEASSVGDSLYSVACGAGGMGIEYERNAYIEKRDRLDQVLTQAGIYLPVRTEIAGLLDENARRAWALGRSAAEREQQWKHKIDHVVTARDDAIAQREAAAAGRAPHPGAGRGCTPRPDRAATPERAAAAMRSGGRRQLHSPEVGR